MTSMDIEERRIYLKRSVSWAKLEASLPSRLSYGLSCQLWLVVFGIFLNYLGYGAILPFEVIYLHSGRGFRLNVAGLVVGLIIGMAILASPMAGRWIDRFGARVTATAAGLALAAGYAGLAFAHTPAQAFAAAAGRARERRAWPQPGDPADSIICARDPPSCYGSLPGGQQRRD